MLVRDVQYHKLTTEHLQVLLTYCEEDLHDHTRQSTAFSVLKVLMRYECIYDAVCVRVFVCVCECVPLYVLCVSLLVYVSAYFICWNWRWDKRLKKGEINFDLRSSTVT